MSRELDLSVERGTGVPLGAQLAGQIRDAVASGRLSEGDRMPSVRELAASAGVNVNTVRSVYARLEAAGVVRSEHGRGTFVAAPPAAAKASAADPPTAFSRRELREQIAVLEAALTRLPPPPTSTEPERRPARAALLSTEELLDVRNRLVDRLAQLEAERSALLESLEELGLEALAKRRALGDRPPEPASSKRSTPSLEGARIRWVGA